MTNTFTDTLEESLMHGGEQGPLHHKDLSSLVQAAVSGFDQAPHASKDTSHHSHIPELAGA